MDIDNFLVMWGAVTGSIGTVISVILAIWTIRKDRRLLKIRYRLTKENPSWLMSDSGDEIDDTDIKYVVINIYNNGFRSILVTDISLKMSDGQIIKHCHLMNNSKSVTTPLPINLSENQNIDAYFDITEFISAFSSRKVFLKRAIVVDMDGNKWNIHIPKSITVRNFHQE
ncbi:MAG TPA: hypothetical protein PLT26_07660 [Anaerolineaceae bacterium]|nr:hypothetical protein [Anaerolineaceae bacterium]HQH85549.1 hypothetical protein [Anaerolineaceae bacterium]